MTDSKADPGAFLQANPLVPVGALFLLGVACGRLCENLGGTLVALAMAAWILWLLAEQKRWHTCAHAALALILLSSGAATWTLNQSYGEQFHVTHFVENHEEKLVALRATVLVPPDEERPGPTRGNRYWIGQAREIWTDHGWLPAAGEILIQWAGGKESATLHSGTQVELYGWISRPTGPLNPGALDPRRLLAADRIFTQLRIPHESGVVLLDASTARGTSWLAAMRTYLKAKLLEHTLQENVPAAYTLTALLLGYRDPAIADVSQSFADAGVAHLLAISGTHILFFTGFVWGVLRLLPIRPRYRELLIAAIVGLYVLATPCGPPIVRAAVALAMVVTARMIGRPRQFLNMLIAAALFVVLLRPTDLLDAGFQLSFITTAGLILFSTRVHAALFARWFELQTLLAELSASRWARWRLRAARTLAAVLVANLIGAATALPLVAYHFGQVNLWAILAGLVALPVVSAAMLVAAIQLLAALVGAGAYLSPLSALVGRAMIWLIDLLAHLPGAAVAVRAPPAWLLLAIYAVLIFWAFRRHIRASRALILNMVLSVAVLTAAWYAFTAPVGALHVTVFSSGDGSCLLLRTPRGELWTLDAGSGQGASVASSAVRPALRLAGSRRLDGQIVTALDVPHAREAGLLMDTWRPRQVWVSGPGWELHGQTLAGTQMKTVADTGIPIHTLHQGQTLDLGAGCTIDVLWPPASGDNLGRKDLILLLTFESKRILIADPASVGALALLPTLRCDAIIFLGVQRGAGDATIRRATDPFLAQSVLWCGRGPWAPKQEKPNEWNTADGAVELSIVHHRLSTARTY